ncbi:MAG: ATP-binding protein [Sporolactobacillus sp.]
MKRLTAMITVIVCYAGLFLILGSWAHSSDDYAPLAKGGILDLTHWNFEKSGSINLNGQWELYPNQLLTPKMFREQAEKNKRFINVPNSTTTGNDAPIQSARRGTYRLIIRSQADNQTFGIQTGVIYSSNKMFLNGKKIGQSGSLTSLSSDRASVKPYVTYFPIHRGSNELVIQITQATGVAGWGIAKPIIFGTEQQISRQHDLILFNDMLMIVAFFIMGIYFLGYYLQRRKDLQLLFFSVFCLLFSVLISWISPGRVVYLIDPGLSFTGLNLLEIVTTLAQVIAVFMYLLFGYSKFVSRKIIISGITLAVLTLILDFINNYASALTSVTLFLHSFLAIFVLAYASYIFMLAILKNVESSIYLAIAALSIGVYVIITTLSAYSTKNLSSLYSVSSILFLLMLSLMASQQFSNAFRRSEQLSDELIRADKMKDQFISRTSHELRTPLNGMINIAQTLLNSPPNQKITEERKKIQLLTRIGYRLSNLVGDILDLEKMKQGIIKLNPAPTDVHTAIQVEFAFYKMLAEKKNLQVINRVPEGLPLVQADENRLRQIINNLVDNAVKYTQKGKITLDAYQVDRQVEIAVTDTGIGISSASLQTIFDPFHRVEWNRSEGAGLGLDIVRQLVELQGGKIVAQSVIGQGSTFRFTLPIVETAEGAPQKMNPVREEIPEAAHPEFTIETPYYSKKIGAPTILVVEDDEDNLGVLIHMLENIPYNVIGVKNGQEALQIVADRQLDLIILDLMMPGMSGYEVCESVRKSLSMIELPILMLTAAIVNEEKYYAFRSGANDILQKPYNFSEFAARIRGLIMMKQSAKQATNMEVAFLQSQIKPHFLYNVLNSIIALSYEDVEKSREMTGQFAAYLRSSFDFQNTTTVSSFRKELSLVQSYLFIEQMRFRERVKVRYDIEEDLDFKMPPLLIQPLIENAVQHGIGKQKKGGLVTLTVRQEGNGYRIIVSDNGVGMSPEQVQTLLTSNGSRSVGLKNINRRLKHFYGTELQIQSTPGQGTIVSISLPLQ